MKDADGRTILQLQALQHTWPSEVANNLGGLRCAAAGSLVIDTVTLVESVHPLLGSAAISRLGLGGRVEGMSRGEVKRGWWHMRPWWE